MSFVVRMCDMFVCLFVCLFDKTDLSDEVKRRLYEVICVAPWTSLDLSGESVMSEL